MTTVRRISSSPICLLTVAIGLTAGGWTWAVADPPQDAGDTTKVPKSHSKPNGDHPVDLPSASNGQRNSDASDTVNSKTEDDRIELGPASGLRPLELPDIDLSQLPQLDPNDDPAAVRVIENAVGGKPLGGPVNDGILSDVIQVIRNSPHRIDMSHLDPDQLTQDRTTGLPQIEGESTASRLTRVRAAEQLLKASRLLERVEKKQSQHMDLVNRMRAEAVSLLSE